MRADRLISLLILLQTQGLMTAEELAQELEVSVRTIYRDVTALSVAGVPIYTDRGPGGGVRLVESYRTNLTGLTRDEARSLLMLGIPAPLTELGLGQEMKAALLKLTAALPSSLREEGGRIRQRIYIDLTRSSQPDEPVPNLPTLQQAAWQDRKLYIKYLSVLGTRVDPLAELVDPYGLVAKAGAWYLVCSKEDRMLVIRRVVPVNRIQEAKIMEESFTRPPDFNLVSFWEAWWAENEGRRPYFPVKARVSPQLLPHLPGYFGERIKVAMAEADPPDEEGWVTLILPFEYLEQARERILGFGRAMEVLEPYALRRSIMDFAGQIVELYGIKDSNS